MTKTIKLTMAESIENCNFSTRLKTALMHLASWRDTKTMNLDDVVELFETDPLGFQDLFLRQPGAGKLTWQELRKFLERLSDPGDCTGRTRVLTFDEAAQMQDALGQVCNHMSSEDKNYRPLRRLQQLLDCCTIHLQQLDDHRPMFHRKDS